MSYAKLSAKKQPGKPVLACELSATQLKEKMAKASGKIKDKILKELDARASRQAKAQAKRARKVAKA